MSRIIGLFLVLSTTVIFQVRSQEFYLSGGLSINVESKVDEDTEVSEGYYVQGLYAHRISPKIGFGIEATYLFTQETSWTAVNNYTSLELSPLLLWNPASTKWANVEFGLVFGTHVSEKLEEGTNPDAADELISPYIGIPFRFGTTAGKFKWYVGVTYQLTEFSETSFGFNETVNRPIIGRIGLGYRIF